MLEWADFRINGQSVGEMGIEVCYAGHWDVPPILVQGTETACREAEQLFPGVVTAAVKHAVHHDLAAGLDAESARRLTAQKVTSPSKNCALGHSSRTNHLPMTVTIQMTTPERADLAAQKPGVKRIDDYTVEKIVDQQCDVVKWIVGQGRNMPPKGK